MATAREQCSNCKHFVALGMVAAGVSGQGQCHRYPPQMLTVTVQAQQGLAMVPIAGFPQVQERDWCGEYAPRQLQAANG